VNLWYVLPPAFAFVLNLSLILLVLQRHWRSLLHRIFAVFLLNMAVWALFIFLMRASPDVQQASIWQLAVTSVAHGTGLFFYHFTVIFTNIRPKRWVLPAGYLLWVIFVILGATGLIVTGSQIKSYGYAPLITPLVGPFMVYTYTFTIMGLVNLFKAHRTSSSNTEKNRADYIIIGICCSLLGAFTDLLPVLGISIYPLGIFGNIAFCLLTAVAILRHHLMDIRVIIRRGASYLLLSTIVAIPYTASALLFGYIISRHLSLAWIWMVILLFVPAFILQPLWSRVQHRVDKLFYRERYDFLKALEDFAEETHSVSELDELGTSLVRLASQALLSSSTRLLLRSKSQDFTTISYSGDNVTPLTLKSDNPLLRWIQTNMKLLRSRDMKIVSQLQSLTLREMTEVREARLELFVPISTKENELAGIIILGEKLNGQPYSEEEERLISSVATRMAVELENARLYDLERTMRAELEEQDKQKTEFLHNVAHELKTPLTAVISSSELLSTQLSLIKPAQIEKLSSNINRSASSMNRRVTELLTYAGMQVGRLNLQLEPLDIIPMLKDIASQFSILFQEREQRFKLVVPDSLPVIFADREKVEEVTVNLLSNASKYSPVGGSIILRSRVADSSLLIEVEDTATPVLDEQKEKLFQPYYRGEEGPEMSKVPGLGLGLAISKTLVELHHGEIWVESNDNKGNIFCFSLPIEKQQ